MKNIVQRFCPACGSKKLEWLLGGNTGDQYKCSECNYQGIVLEGDDDFIKSFKEKLSER